jgi:S-formylglutathione hydrolase
MASYIEDELPALIATEFPMADLQRQGIAGHSMGGHGALTIGLRNRGRFRGISALAPIASPMNCPWGIKALTGYLGPDQAAWRGYDACALIADGARADALLVDQGDADPFLADQLKPELLKAACETAGLQLTLRMQPGYDHSYYFISTYLAEHIAWHAQRMKG